MKRRHTQNRNQKRPTPAMPGELIIVHSIQKAINISQMTSYCDLTHSIIIHYIVIFCCGIFRFVKPARPCAMCPTINRCCCAAPAIWRDCKRTCVEHSGAYVWRSDLACVARRTAMHRRRVSAHLTTLDVLSSPVRSVFLFFYIFFSSVDLVFCCFFSAWPEQR